SARLFSNARNTAARLARYNGLTAEPLYHPPPLAGKLRAGPLGDYVLSVGRLETVKRVDLIVGALAHADRSVRLIVVGEGTLGRPLEGQAAGLRAADRVTWAGGGDQPLRGDHLAGRRPTSGRRSVMSWTPCRSSSQHSTKARRLVRSSPSSSRPRAGTKSSSSTMDRATTRAPTPRRPAHA